MTQIKKYTLEAMDLVCASFRMATTHTPPTTPPITVSILALISWLEDSTMATTSQKHVYSHAQH